RRVLFCVFLFIFCLSALSLEARAGFLYALDQVNGSPNQIYGFSVNESTGALTLLAGFPVVSGGNGGAGSFSDHVAVDRLNRRLYVVNEGSLTLSAFTIN